MKRIPTLDGWRGVAILLVLVTHFQAGRLGHPYKYRWMDLAQHGVTIFFVLSGYLITRRLVAGELKGLRSFYVRRFFRIMPVVWIYLLCVFILGWVLKLNIIGKDALASLFFFRNYLADSSQTALTGHFWSLSIEEQFYICFPVLLIVLKPRKTLGFVLTGSVLVAFWRLLAWPYYSRGYSYLHTEVRIDALLVGCAAGLLCEYAWFIAWVQRFNFYLFAGSFGVFLACVYRFQAFIPLTEEVAIACMLLSTSLNPQSSPSLLLQNKHLSFVGLISYSLYVWQQIFLVPHWDLFVASFLPLTAVLSYMFVERPCQELGRRLSMRFGRGAGIKTVRT